MRKIDSLETTPLNKLALSLVCIGLLIVGSEAEQDSRLFFSPLNGVNARAPPSWDKSYYVSGLLELPYAEIKEPFMAYWDAKHNRSRIDYYGKTVVTIQIGWNGKTDYGQSYKVAPMSTEQKLNMRACFLVNGTSVSPMSPQSILPLDMKDFKFVGEELMHGLECDVWQKTLKVEQKKNVYTMYVQKESNKPVRYEMIGYDTLLGSHYDKYYLNYYNDYTPTLLNDTIFKVDTKSLSRACGSFPGPGDDEHRILINPMREYLHNDDSHIDSMFENFKKTHNKQYQREDESIKRKHLFRQNVRFIHSKNRAGLGFQLGVNHLADFTGGELKIMRGYRASKGYNHGMPFDKGAYRLKDIPEQKDWRLYGAVTPVKDQAVCGSCWSFGTAGTVEGAHFLKTGELIRLSQQALMDCSWGEGNNACDGGEDFRAYQWIMKHGLPTEESYGPYLAQDSYCHNQNATTGAKMKGFVNVTSGDLEALKIAIAKHGPISVAIDASHKSLSFYSNGVYYEPKCGSGEDALDHAVLAVGYGVMEGKPYWLIKNSWSTYWGNAGYVLMSQKDNNCGVATSPTYVIM